MSGLYQFLGNHSIYIVLIIVLIVWVGVFMYLFNLDKRIKEVEKDIKGDHHEK